jgi:hypothetical protein
MGRIQEKLQESLVESSVVMLVERRCSIIEAIMLSYDGYVCGLGIVRIQMIRFLDPTSYHKR